MPTLTELIVESSNKELEFFENMEKSYKERKSQIFYQSIELLLKNTSVKCISFVGTTPSFNDGDPCTHSEDCFTFTTSPLDEDGAVDEDGEEVDYTSDEGSTWISGLKDEAKVKPLWDLLHRCNYGILEDKHETDYCVKFYLGEDGKVAEDYEYCDRGY